jgi:sialate O-acetylesterase
MFKLSNFLFLVPLICFLVSIQAQTNTSVKLSINKLFSDQMILQQNSNIILWGKSASYEKVFINTSWGSKQSTTASEFGEWEVNIKTLGASYKQHQITVHGMNQEIKIKNVLIGEVWLASGQSNMEMDFNYCCNTTDYSAKEMQSANFPSIRMFNVKKRVEKTPTNIVEGNWIAAIGKDITNFSAAAYFFAKKLHEKLDLPIGIIHASWGGSDAEAWISKKKLSSITFAYQEYDQKNIDGTSKANKHINFDTNDAFIKQATKAEKWFSMFNRIDLQSIIYYLNMVYKEIIFHLKVTG